MWKVSKIKSAENGKEVNIKENALIKEACEDLGVPFGCQNGICGVCTIEIVEGGKNLQPLNDREEAMGCNDKKRLACQCKIKKGNIKIKF